MTGASTVVAAVLGAGLAVLSTGGCACSHCRTFTVLSSHAQNRGVTTSCLNLHSITLDAPRAGQVVVRAHVSGEIGHLRDQDDYLVFSLATTSQDCAGAFSGGLEGQMPDGRYLVHPSGEKVFTVPRGTHTFYLNVRSQHATGGSVAVVQLSATFQPQ
jgi:hypothetical protein